MLRELKTQKEGGDTAQGSAAGANPPRGAGEPKPGGVSRVPAGPTEGAVWQEVEAGRKYNPSGITAQSGLPTKCAS